MGAVASSKNTARRESVSEGLVKKFGMAGEILKVVSSLKKVDLQSRAAILSLDGR